MQRRAQGECVLSENALPAQRLCEISSTPQTAASISDCLYSAPAHCSSQSISRVIHHGSSTKVARSRRYSNSRNAGEVSLAAATLDLHQNNSPDNRKNTSNIIRSCLTRQRRTRSADPRASAVIAAVNDTSPKWSHIGSPSATMNKSHKDRFYCPYDHCTKSFTRPFNLHSHIRVHTGERPFVCKECTRSFSRLHDLKRHIQSLHDLIKPYQCCICKKNFSRSDAIDRHIKSDPKCLTGHAHRVNTHKGDVFNFCSRFDTDNNYTCRRQRQNTNTSLVNTLSQKENVNCSLSLDIDKSTTDIPPKTFTSTIVDVQSKPTCYTILNVPPASPTTVPSLQCCSNEHTLFNNHKISNANSYKRSSIYHPALTIDTSILSSLPPASSMIPPTAEPIQSLDKMIISPSTITTTNVTSNIPISEYPSNPGLFHKYLFGDYPVSPRDILWSSSSGYPSFESSLDMSSIPFSDPSLSSPSNITQLHQYKYPSSNDNITAIQFDELPSPILLSAFLNSSEMTNDDLFSKFRSSSTTIPLVNIAPIIDSITTPSVSTGIETTSLPPPSLTIPAITFPLSSKKSLSIITPKFTYNANQNQSLSCYNHQPYLYANDNIPPGNSSPNIHQIKRSSTPLPLSAFTDNPMPSLPLSAIESNFF